MKNTLLLLTLLTACTTAAAAQERIDRTIQTGATGRVEIHNLAGTIRVTAWDRNEIQVTGTLGRGAERLDVTGGAATTRIQVVLPAGRTTGRVEASHLEVRVPARKDVVLTSTSANLTVTGVAGRVEGRSTSGDVVVEGPANEVRATSTSGDVRLRLTDANLAQVRSTSGDVEVRGTVRTTVDAETVSGDVVVDAAAPEVRARAVSGDISLDGVGGRVSASTVSGNTRIRNSRIQFGAFESVSGNLNFDGELLRGAAFNIQTHSGTVELRVPANVSAAFEARTFSGRITSEIGSEAVPTDRRNREFRFTAGGGDGQVSMRTFSGDIRILRR